MSKARNLANLLADGAVGASELADTLDLSGKTLSLPEGVGGGVTTDSEANRPASPAVGTLFFNTTADTLQQFTSTGWLDVGSVPLSISTISGNIFSTIQTALTIVGDGFGLSATVRFSYGGSTSDVAVTPATNNSLQVSVPSGVYSLAAGTAVTISVIVSGRVSNGVTKSVVSLPTGGTITTANGYRTHTFNSSSSFVANSGANLDAEYIIVAGGGGGGGGTSAGGGAGGVIRTSSTLTPGTYSINIGQGGSGGPTAQAGTSGANTTAFGLTAIGGGRAGSTGDAVSFPPATGGSGGGGSRYNGYGQATGAAGTSGQGNSGGNYFTDDKAGGGGGGAGSAGLTPSASNNGDGGAGVEWPVGSGNYYGGGGGASADSTGKQGAGGNGGGGAGAFGTNNGTPGTQNTGGGGGGAYAYASGAGGAGGSGIVIIRYQL